MSIKYHNSLLVLGCLLIAIPYSLPAKLSNHLASQDVEFQVSSLNASGNTFVTLTISIDASGDATVAKSTRPANPDDQTMAHVLGSNLDITASCEDSCLMDVVNHNPGEKCFWFDIELDSLPSIQSGGSTLTFYCESHNCDGDGKCAPAAMITNNKANVSCVGPCQRCVLKARTSGSVTHDGGGVFLYAKSVTYL